MANSSKLAANCGLPNDTIYIFASPDLVPLDDKFPGKGWINIAPFGIWKGHPNGEIKFDQKKMGKIISEFDKLTNPLQIDYHHQSLTANEAYGGVPAAGWLHALEIRPDTGLWGYIMLTQRATDMVRNGEMLYCSPVIVSNSTDRKTKDKIDAEMFNLALTNDPFLDGQKPIQLGRTLSMADKIVTTTANATEASPMDATAAINLLAEQTGMEPAAVLASLVDNLEAIGKILQGAKGTEGMPQEEKKVAPVEEKPVAASAEPALVVPSKWEGDRASTIEAQRVVDLSNRVKSLEDEKTAQLNKRVLARVDEKIKGGYIRDEHKEDAIFLFTSDWDRAERVFSAKIVPIGVTQSGGPVGDPHAKADTYESLNDVDKKAAELVQGMANCSREEAVKKILARKSAN